jgi:hypothetical protein
MSPRTLTAGKSEQPSRFLPDAYQGECEALLWSALADLFYVARRRTILVPAIARLDAWLTKAYFWLVRNPTHPELNDRQERYRVKADRLHELRGELNGLEGEAESLRKSISTHWERLRTPRQREISADPEWPCVGSGDQVASALWTMACTPEKRFPGMAEPPF